MANNVPQLITIKNRYRIYRNELKRKKKKDKILSLEDYLLLREVFLRISVAINTENFEYHMPEKLGILVVIKKKINPKCFIDFGYYKKTNIKTRNSTYGQDDIFYLYWCKSYSVTRFKKLRLYRRVHYINKGRETYSGKSGITTWRNKLLNDPLESNYDAPEKREVIERNRKRKPKLKGLYEIHESEVAII